MAECVYIDASVGPQREKKIRNAALSCGFKICEYLQKGVTICVCNSSTISEEQPSNKAMSKVSRRTKMMVSGNLEQVSTAKVSVSYSFCFFEVTLQQMLVLFIFLFLSYTHISSGGSDHRR
jgi:hypothetical protein